MMLRAALERGSYRTTDAYDHERRFLLSSAQADAFAHRVAPWTTVQVHDPGRPVEFTRTTYLDTDDLAFLGSSEGLVRHRLRVREYACAPDLTMPPLLTGRCFLELKQARDASRSTVRIAAPPEVIAQIVSGGDRVGALPGIRIASLGALQQRLRAARFLPRLSTWYRRSCLSDDAGLVRITLDRTLAFCRPQPIGAAGTLATPDEIVAHGPERLMEVKYQGEEPAWLAAALAPLAEATQYSKFVAGMRALMEADAMASAPVIVIGALAASAQAPGV